jgi:hypothetical protein
MDDPACAGSTGRDGGDREDLRHDAGRAEPRHPARGIVRTHRREPGGDRGNRCAGNGGAGGGTGADRGQAAGRTGTRGNCAGTARTTRDRGPAGNGRTTGGRATRGARATGGARSTGRGRAATARSRTGASSGTGGDGAASAQRRAEHRRLQLPRQRHGQNQRERSPLMADLVLEGRAARAAIDMRA